MARLRKKHPVCEISGFSKISHHACRCAECLKYRAACKRQRRKNYPDMVKRYNLQRRFGLSLETWRAMLAEQDGKCAVCKQEEFGVNQGCRMSLAVDHDHLTGNVRALLCHRCNRALGLLGDDAERVQELAYYRRRF